MRQIFRLLAKFTSLNPKIQLHLNIMNLIQITTENFRTFHDAARILYQGDSNRIAPLDMEIENIFDPSKNDLFKDGEAIRWILQDDSGHCIGRVAAFINYHKARKSEIPAGGIGFFECIDSQEAANLLFDAGKKWLLERGMKAMDGSINFGENFSYWGVLVEGFTQQGYGMPYNKPYYQKLFETYGFRDFFQQHSYHIDITKPFPERMVKFAEYQASRPGYSFRHYEKKNAGKYISDLVSVFNTTWSDYLEDFTPMTERDLDGVMESAKPVIVEDFIWFAYKDERPVGMVIAFPDLNQVLAHFNGRVNTWVKMLKFMLLKNGKTITRNRVLIAGVIPEYQNSGVIGSLFLQFTNATKSRKHYTEIELSWVGDYNPRMRKVYEQIGAVPKKKHITYRYMLDPAVPFNRFTNERGNSNLRKDSLKKDE
ncbi:MAG TPA: N-acetyltransferase [Bacteroidales bacterium]|nr:N-acetyltransferase [Bacteroidales bacterium]